jgi:uncharacterized protein
MRRQVAEETVHFHAENLILEGLWEEQPGECAVVLAAAHPLYGATMDDEVINTVRLAYREQGFTTLRFNYRGVGGSEGELDADAGPGKDLAAALSYVADQGKRKLEIAGYSFGAWLAFTALQADSPARRGILVAPPIDAIRFSGASDKIRLVVGAADDHFASPRSLERLVPRWSHQARLVTIPDANHYFMLKLDHLAEILREFLSDGRRR